jgi:hypothetical protein
MSRRRVLRQLLSVVAGCAAGCRLPGRRDPDLLVSLPSRHSVLSDQLVIQSDFRLQYDHPLIKDLLALKREVSSTLALEFNGPPVVVYLFENEQKYVDYLVSTWPSLPYRRAYFFGNSHELAVYTFWGENVQEDLRHEFTHGLLNSALQNLPLWLDEGLAEYFEVPGQPGTAKPAVVQRLGQALSNGWQPDMAQLEALADVTTMTQSNYEEAWAWVHFLLHSQSAQRDVLLSYLQSLRQSRFPGPLSQHLKSLGINASDRFAGHVATLSSFGTRTALVPE